MAPYSGDDALASLLRASWQASAGASLVAGVAVHHTVFRCYEIDGYAWQLVFVHLGAMAALLASYIQTGEHQLASALFRVLVVANAYFVGVASSILLYRALFHPLHRFPGPFGAKLTRFYSMRTAIKSMKNYEDVQRLHRVYGDIVRVGESLYTLHSTTGKVEDPIRFLCFSYVRMNEIECFPSNARRPARTVHQ